jgi:single-stranded-DNA-specific exonuclease
MGNTGRHLSVDVEQNGIRLRAVAFGGADWFDELKKASNEPICIAFQPVLNQFRGRVSIEMHLADWRPDAS